jgi:cytochrome c6
MNFAVARFGSATLFPFLLFLALPTTTRAQSDGASLYKSKCAVCHGANGDSSTTSIGKSMKIRDLRSADVQSQSDEQLSVITKGGKGKMPSYQGKLSEEQVNQLVAFMRSLAKK